MRAENICARNDHLKTVSFYDSNNRLLDVRPSPFEWDTRSPRTAPDYKFEHDTQKRLFVLTAPGGKPEYFRDNPVRQLLVEPDPETGELRPVIMRGKPAYIYLCREERRRDDQRS